MSKFHELAMMLKVHLCVCIQVDESSEYSRVPASSAGVGAQNTKSACTH